MGYKHGTKFAMPLIIMGAVLALNFTKIVGLTTSSPSIISGRILLQTDNNISEPLRQSDDNTVRVDPLDSLKKYRGGYDITNKHYWSSTIYTGIGGYAIGVLWLLCGMAYAGFLLITTFCCTNKKKRKPKKRFTCNKQSCLWPILTATLFTILAIVASGLVLGGTARFYSRAKSAVDIIIDTANDASQTIYNTTGAMKDMKNNLEAYNGGGEVSTFLNSTSQKLDDEAADIERQASKNRRLIDKGLQIVFAVTIVTISLNLIAAVALSVFGVLKFRWTLHPLITLCWILTVLCWVFFGLYFFLGSFLSDTCIALKDFQQDPYNNSLSSLLPCYELLSAKSVLSDVSAEIYNLINEVNANISIQQATGNSSIVQICNPFSAPPDYKYQPENCPSDAIQIGDIPQVLKVLTCSDTSNGTCQDGESISNSVLKTVEAYTTSIQDLLDAYPGMDNLVTCKSVEDAFSEILLKHCKPLKRYVRMVWASMVFLAVVMVILVLVWTTNVHHERNHHSSDGSVKPYSAAENKLESRTAEAVNNNQIPSSIC